MATQPMKMSRKVTSRRNKKLAAMSTEYDRQNMLDEEDAGTSRMARRNISELNYIDYKYISRIRLGALFVRISV